MGMLSKDYLRKIFDSSLSNLDVDIEIVSGGYVIRGRKDDNCHESMFHGKAYSAAQIMNFVAKAIPYPNQVKIVDEQDGGDLIINWRSTFIRIKPNLSIYEYESDGVDIGSDISILFETLIHRTAMQFEMEKGS